MSIMIIIIISAFATYCTVDVDKCHAWIRNAWIDVDRLYAATFITMHINASFLRESAYMYVSRMLMKNYPVLLTKYCVNFPQYMSKNSDW